MKRTLYRCFGRCAFLALTFLCCLSLMGQQQTDNNMPIQQPLMTNGQLPNAVNQKPEYFESAVLPYKQTTYLKREMRCAWVATVYCIDYPSTTGLSVNTLKSQYVALISSLKNAGINAIFFQIRPSCDAFYNSPYEPWSEWLMGTQGVAPAGGFDPLVFFVDEAHKQGIEFHAWLNPYRAVVNINSSSVAGTHISVTHPSWCVTYNTIKLLNPGLPQVRSYLTTVVADIVNRYGVDGIHFDDYFYPYPQTGYVFDDDAAFAADPRGFTNKADWRRDNVNLMVAMVNDTIKSLKPWVKFGIGPFGIWKNGVPAGITGLSSYDAIYCDPIAWLNDHSIDYVSPQLYWKIGTNQDFNTLVDWWGTQAATNGRHCYAGMASYQLNPSGGNWTIMNILDQINSTRVLNYKVQGNVFYNTSSITDNLKNFADSLSVSYNKYKCLLPTMPWLDSVAPLPPLNATFTATTNSITLSWQAPAAASDGDSAKYYVIYRQTDGSQVNIADPKQILCFVPDSVTSYNDNITLASYPGIDYVITSCDKLHNESLPVNININIDNVAPVTTTNVAGAWQTQDFTATFTDTDNTGGSGIEKSYYQVLDFDGTEWHANATKGFFCDNFDTYNTPVWSVPAGSGTWTVNNGKLMQTDTSVSNTNIYAKLNQGLSNRYLYDFNLKIDPATHSTSQHRFGFHFYSDSGSLSNRGNSYFIFFRQETSALEFYRVVNNVYTQTKVVNNVTTNLGQWYNIKVIHDRITGKISVYRDNVFLSSWTDTSPLTTSGKYFSFRTGNSKVYLDELKIYRSRYPSVTVTVGNAADKDIRYQNPGPATHGAKIKSIVNDAAGNLSAIDYYDLNIDWTPPVCSTVHDGTGTDTDTTTSATTLSANWTASTDTNSGIAGYWYAIGTTPGDTNITGWTNNALNTSVTKNGLSLINGQTYYFSVKTENGAGLKTICSSDGAILFTPTGISENADESVIFASPNPFNKTTVITYFSASEREITVILTDMYGRELVLSEKTISKGKNTLTIDAEELKLLKGIYVLKIRAHDFSSSLELINY